MRDQSHTTKQRIAASNKRRIASRRDPQRAKRAIKHASTFDGAHGEACDKPVQKKVEHQGNRKRDEGGGCLQRLPEEDITAYQSVGTRY